MAQVRDSGTFDKDSSEFTSVDRAANQARLSWLALVTLVAYLFISISSVTHRMLLLESPLKLPVLNVELSLLGFFVVAPIFLLIFHFYTLLQFVLLSNRIRSLKNVLHRTTNAASLRQTRARLDPFVLAQFLAQTGDSYRNVLDRLFGLITWASLLIIPLTVLLQFQIVFLPYHNEAITCWHRTAVMLDLALAATFWHAALSYQRTRVLWINVLRIVGVLCVAAILFVSILIASYPGERLMAYRPEVIESITETVFGGKVNEVVKRARTPFSNVLILNDDDFGDSKLSLRGRDLRGAIFARSKLRGGDFVGSNLSDANFDGAVLIRARFGCANTGAGEDYDEYDDKMFWPDDGCTWLQRTSLVGTQLQGAIFRRARAQGAQFDEAVAYGSDWYAARLEGASFSSANLIGSYFKNADLTAADLDSAHLEATILETANLQGANLSSAYLQGALLDRADIDGVSMEEAHVWRSQTDPRQPEIIDLTKLDLLSGPDFDALGVRSFNELRGRVLEFLTDDYDISSEQKRKLVAERLGILNKRSKFISPGIPFTNWKRIASQNGRSSSLRDNMTKYLTKLACAAEGAPGALGIVHRRDADWRAVVQRLKDVSTCLAGKHLQKRDWDHLERLIASDDVARAAQ